jgi:hypothetical protein
VSGDTRAIRIFVKSPACKYKNTAIAKLMRPQYKSQIVAFFYVQDCFCYFQQKKEAKLKNRLSYRCGIQHWGCRKSRADTGKSSCGAGANRRQGTGR